MLSPHWNLRSQFGPLARLRRQYETAAQQLHPLFHANQSEPADFSRLSGIEADALIGDAQFDSALNSGERHDGLPSARMPGHVMQRFLRHPVKAKRRVGRQGFESILNVERNRDSFPVGE